MTYVVFVTYIVFALLLKHLSTRLCNDAKLRLFVMFVFRERPVINTQTVNLDYLQSLPLGTLGREYVDWLHVNVCTVFSRSVCFCCFIVYAPCCSVCDICITFA